MRGAVWFDGMIVFWRHGAHPSRKQAHSPLRACMVAKPACLLGLHHRDIIAARTGNHFIEGCLDESDTVWLMLHSGSREIGNKIGTYFIEKAKEEMLRWYIELPDPELAYLPESTPLFGDYVKALTWAQAFARANRGIMMNRVLAVL